MSEEKPLKAPGLFRGLQIRAAPRWMLDALGARGEDGILFVTRELFDHLKEQLPAAPAEPPAP